MADILAVIQDILVQDKQQKREHSKIMREVQRKLKEKEVSEEEGDKEEYQAFVKKTLKRFGVKSPAELGPDKKKEFFDALDAGWEADDEKPEPEDEEKSLGDRVKQRIEQDEDEPTVAPYEGEDSEDDDEEEDEGDKAEGEDEEDFDEPSDEQLDKIADLVVQKLRDKVDKEEDEEEEPEGTEAEAGEEEEIDTKPKMEMTHQKYHSRKTWEEVLQKVHLVEQGRYTKFEIVKSDIKTRGPWMVKLFKKDGSFETSFAKTKSQATSDAESYMKMKEEWEKKLKKIKGKSPADAGYRAAIEDDIAKEKVKKNPDKKLIEAELDEASDFETLADIIKVLQERPEYSNFIPLDRKFYETFAKKAKKAGLTWETFEKYVKGTFKDNADKSKALLFAKDVFKESVEIEVAETSTGKDSDSIEGDTKGVKHKCPSHVKKEGYGYGKNLSHTLSENIVDKMNIYWFDKQEVSFMMPIAEVEVITEDHHSNPKAHQEKFKSTKKIAEGYTLLPPIDRERYTEMRGLEGPFITRSGKVLYYDPKEGQYYDRDRDMYLSYDEYNALDAESPSAKQYGGVFDDPRSREYKKMIRDKAKAEKKAKKAHKQLYGESTGMNFARKFYQKGEKE